MTCISVLLLSSHAISPPLSHLLTHGEHAVERGVCITEDSGQIFPKEPRRAAGGLCPQGVIEQEREPQGGMGSSWEKMGSGQTYSREKGCS